jgi:hypothetical protein
VSFHVLRKNEASDKAIDGEQRERGGHDREGRDDQDVK